MVIGGFYLGMALETFRRLSPYWRKSAFLTYFLEITFWLTQTFILFYILYRVNAGELRVYVFIACLLGFSIYKGVAVNLYKRLLESIIQMNKTFFNFFKRILLILVVNPIKWVLYLVVTLITGIFSILFYLIKLVLSPVRWVLRGLISLLPEKIQKIFPTRTRFYSIIKNKCVTCMKNMKFKRR